MTLEIAFEGSSQTSQTSLDEHKLWECVLDERTGKPRLRAARSFFRPLLQGDIDKLVEGFEYWRDFTEYLVMRAENQITEEKQYFAVKCSKRGNDVFAARLDSSLGFLKADVQFFNPNDFENRSQHKKVKTRLLWTSLTYGSKRCSLDEAWRNLAPDFNLWITNLRNKYGRISYVAFPQSFPDKKGSAYGYPHFHIIMLFEDTEFTVFRRMEKGRNGKFGLVYRIEEKDDLHSQGKWHSFTDFKALRSMKAVWNYAKKHCFNAGYGESEQATLNNAIMWVYRKKSFNMSGEFRSRYTEFIMTLHKSKEIFYPLLDGGRLNEWKLTCLGVFSVFELCIEEDPPPWVVSLSSERISSLLDRSLA